MFSTNAISAADAALGGTQSAQDKAKLEDELNKFLNLLVTQLKNQDPLDPMDATEFTSQLVQFASVEQQIYQNANLEKLLETAHVSQVSNLANFLGKTVEAQTDSFNLAAGTADFSYKLTEKAQSTTVNISDSSGKIVYSTVGSKTNELTPFTWDGVDNYGTQLPDGEYSFAIDAKDEAGEPIEYSRSVTGIVTAAGADAGNVNLFLGDVPISLDDILTIKQ
ncbi:MAG: flagellar hook assembly protein FlgD [Rhodospirillaceae bacterium]|nr:flagellar hook assembly protein FlgD [Rhodospirillaceae bacterium]